MASTNTDKASWAEEEEEEQNQIEPSGIKETVTYTTNSRGQNVKVISKIQVTEFKRRVPRRVAARKNLPRFGLAKDNDDQVTLRSPDFVSMEHPSDQQADDAADPSLAKTLANFIAKQNEKKLMQAVDLDSWGNSDSAAADPSSDKPSSSGGGKYVAPGSRPGGSTTIMSGFDDGSNNKGTENTLRVSNLTKAVTEDDIRDLFERFGRILRVSIPQEEDREKDKDGKVVMVPRGYAYLVFARREDAEIALERLNGHGYDHLILRVEWAKPPREGGAMNANFQSGYGKKLAQDTSEKAKFFSQH